MTFMKKIIFIVLPVLLLVFFVNLFFWLPKAGNEITPAGSGANVQSTKQNQQNNPDTSLASTTTASNSAISDFSPSLPRTKERVTKKPFGIYITPATSPVQPERFKGYHTGVDFEIFPDELKEIVNVQAVCTGKLKLKEYASGYGGVAVQDCKLDKQPMTVVYGHLKLASINKKAGDSLKAGEVIGVLGAANSQETNGERKHLHLGFHKGTSINIKGYVSVKSGLTDWLDPCLYVCHD